MKATKSDRDRYMRVIEANVNDAIQVRNAVLKGCRERVRVEILEEFGVLEQYEQLKMHREAVKRLESEIAGVFGVCGEFEWSLKNRIRDILSEDECLKQLEAVPKMFWDEILLANTVGELKVVLEKAQKIIAEIKETKSEEVEK